MRPVFKSLKIEDAKALQELIGQHLDAIQPGLTKLDKGVLLGGSTIDLVALDARDTLVLIAVAFQADEALLLRALEGYSWCLEYPDGVKRLYPEARVTRERPPRVTFIAESMPEAFLRKIKHLKFKDVECLEFRFGLELRPVASLRGDGDAAAPQAPGTLKAVDGPAPRPREVREPREPRPAPAEVRPIRESRDAPRPAPAESRPLRESRDVRGPRDVREVPREVPREVREPREARESPARPREAAAAARDPFESLPGLLGDLKTPANGETGTASKKAATKAPGQIEDSKLRIVREYLQREFPTAVIYDFYQADRVAQVFHLQDRHGNIVHVAVVAEDLLDEQAESEIRSFLEKHKLARVLRQAGQAGVVVAKGGLKIERR